MKREKSEITRKVIEAQKRNSIKGDLYNQVKSDMDYLNITELDICIKSEEQLKRDLISKIDSAAYQYLIDKSQNHSKTRTKLYKNLNGSSYLFDSRFSPDLARLIFSFWTQTYGVKNNFRNKYQRRLRRFIL